jgi:Rhamnan synthesis protein F/Glycosyl transferases group 1
MALWHGRLVRGLARNLPSWIKHPAKRLLVATGRISRQLGLVRTYANRLKFPTAGMLADRDTIVIIVHDATRTGAPILAWNLVLNLNRKYNTVVLLRAGGPLQSAFQADAAAVICLPERFPETPAEIEALAQNVTEIYSPKYAIANTVETRNFVAQFEAVGVPVVALVHEFSRTYRPAGVLHGLFSAASYVVFPARVVAEDAAADYKILQARDWRVLAHGRPKLPRIGRADQLKQSLLISKNNVPVRSDGSVRVVGIGTITMRKGVDLFIAVAATTLQILPNHKIDFTWVGTHFPFDQNYYDSLKAQIESDGLDDVVQFIGELEDLEPVYERADIFLLASRLDPLPNVAIDSAIRGIPVVCFDQAGGIAEIFSEHDETRDLVVPYLDVYAAAKLICKLAIDSDLREHFSIAVAEVAHQRFSMEDYVQKIDELGLRASQFLQQSRHDIETISKNNAFNLELNLGHDAVCVKSAKEGISHYLRNSRLAAPWHKPLAGTFMRRPLEGFNPLIYARENPLYDPNGFEDPLAHFARTGRPAGSWTHRVIVPTKNSVPRITSFKIAVHGHFHYPELLPDFLARLKQNTNQFDLFLTTTSPEKVEQLAKALSGFQLGKPEIRLVSNYGRDLAPFLQAIREDLFSGYDVVGHFHGKRSPHVDKEIGNRWRNFLWEHLLGGEFAMADNILRVFAEHPRVGLVFAEDPCLNGWDENFEIAKDLARRMKLARSLPTHFNFPIGTMFWARPDALKQFNRLNLRLSDFPQEPLPIDGTLLHALERLVPFAVEDCGYEYATTYVRNSKR